ncbi:MAG TPA: oligopeptide transporter, OPT family [Gemmatales bacterium]|nr:oligopeptide transporter, OPT family [Gemmatales bacterium]HMP58325.1 oligopeptide transporter, OPT family [Gemmatales bacterium]
MSQEFKPYVPANVRMPEFTVSAVLLGTSLGLIFAASSLYLVLKVGMTVSASIPVAVLAITLFRGLSKAFGLRQATILENNIVQTAGSAGESIAFGAGVTMPALMMLGFNMDLPRVMTVSIMGGILGILAMIPLRRAFIVRMHGRPGQPGTLLYPEGVAAAQVLISGEKGGTTGKAVFIGFGIAFVHKFATLGLNLLRETVAVPVAVINKAAVFAMDMATELLGVGYIIGVRTASIMMAGAVLGYMVIVPVIYFIGSSSNEPVAPANISIRAAEEAHEKDPDNNPTIVTFIRNNYLLYIGAGCVAAAGVISMGKTLPMIIKSLGGMVGMGVGADGEVRRTDHDLPLTFVLGGSLLLLILLGVFLAAEVGLLAGVAGAILVLLFGFLFVTVSARLTGEIGSSSNPISGMTSATLMMTCLIFLALGWVSSQDRVLALCVAGVVCIASSNGGTTAQSLKTGFLVGGTPWAMQCAILVGALVSAVVIGGTLLAFNAAGTIYSADPIYLPKDAQGQILVLTAEERSRLDEQQTHEGKNYLVWDSRRDAFTKDRYQARKELLKVPEGSAPEGRFLVDPDSGKVALLVDPMIGGKIKSVDGKPVSRFDAPKTRVMQIIIDGVLTLKLNWSLVLIGAMIAVTLELCGVSSLAFAVGLYVPIQFSAPIFVGGIVRWLVDSYLKGSARVTPLPGESAAETAARAEVEAIRRTETSPGVLLASGYIAGGSLAGVVVAFLAFSEPVQNALNLSELVAKVDAQVAMMIAVGLFVPVVLFLWAVGRELVFPPPAEPATLEAPAEGGGE